jgi:hypothetical protein
MQVSYFENGRYYAPLEPAAAMADASRRVRPRGGLARLSWQSQCGRFCGALHQKPCCQPVILAPDRGSSGL